MNGRLDYNSKYPIVSGHKITKEVNINYARTRFPLHTTMLGTRLIFQYTEEQQDSNKLKTPRPALFNLFPPLYNLFQNLVILFLYTSMGCLEVLDFGIDASN